MTMKMNKFLIEQIYLRIPLIAVTMKFSLIQVQAINRHYHHRLGGSWKQSKGFNNEWLTGLFISQMVCFACYVKSTIKVLLKSMILGIHTHVLDSVYKVLLHMSTVLL